MTKSVVEYIDKNGIAINPQVQGDSRVVHDTLCEAVLKGGRLPTICLPVMLLRPGVRQDVRVLLNVATACRVQSVTFNCTPWTGDRRNANQNWFLHIGSRSNNVTVIETRYINVPPQAKREIASVFIVYHELL